VGGALFGLDVEAWKGGPRLRVFVVSDPGEDPVVACLEGRLRTAVASTAWVWNAAGTFQGCSRNKPCP
jgi:hypothetical protein